MKEIFLSFKPEYFKPILYGMKKYEYRKRFCHEETKAYLYLSSKKQMVIGVMELGIPIRLNEHICEYRAYPETYKRVEKYIAEGDVCAIPIKSLSLFYEPITLAELRKQIPNFKPPRMYYVLNSDSKLKSFLETRKIRDKEFIHKHDKVYYDNLALSVREMMMDEKFKKIDSVVLYMSDYKDII